MIDVGTVLANLVASTLAVGAGTLITHRVTAAVQGKRLDDHDKRLDDHDTLHRQTAARFESLNNDFVPRREADLQFAGIRESQGRTEIYLRYLVFGEKPKPPENV